MTPESLLYFLYNYQASAILKLRQTIHPVFKDVNSPPKEADKTEPTNAEEGEFHGNDVHRSAPIKVDTARLLECCSCMCCVKAISMYKGRRLREKLGRPALPACETETDCGARWGILGVLSVFLPCLVCYAIIKLCCDSSFNYLIKLMEII